MVFLLGCAALFAVGIVQLFRLRFEVGDVYPPYSSLRSDPLGTMALYEGLERLPGISARRDYAASNRLPEEPNTVYLHLAAGAYDWNWVPDDLFRELDAFLARGGRLVITFFPQTRESFDYFEYDEAETNVVKSVPPKNGKQKNKDEKSAPSKPGRKKHVATRRGVSLDDRWGFHVAFQKLEHVGDAYEPAQVRNRTDLPLPPALDWHSGNVLTNLDAAWRTIYARGTNAVVVERRFGRGTVVIATDSYLLSNEAMWKDRHADFLAWLVGSNRNVVFDEAHLGVLETSGVTVLMRKYRLHGLAAGLLLLAGLFIWKNSVSLVPPPEDEAQRDFLAGKDASAGFVNLLRRSIPRRELFAACFQEWRKSAARTGQYSAARLQQADAVFQAESSAGTLERDPIRAYRTIANILQTPNPKPDTRHSTLDARHSKLGPRHPTPDL